MTRSLAFAAFTVALAAPPVRPQTPSFEVASVKPVTGGDLETRFKRSGGRVTWTTDFWYLIGYAYHLPLARISGAIPAEASIYRVEAKTAPSVTDAQLRQMFQSLLRDRFQLSAHVTTREENGYALSVGKKGLKIHAAQPDDPPPPLPEWSRGTAAADFESHISATLPGKGLGAITGRRVSFSQLAETLQIVLQAPVWDRTGIPGNYYFGFKYAAKDDPEVDAPTLAGALQEYLGLKLERQKGPVEFLVVDHIDREAAEN